MHTASDQMAVRHPKAVDPPAPLPHSPCQRSSPPNVPLRSPPSYLCMSDTSPESLQLPIPPAATSAACLAAVAVAAAAAACRGTITDGDEDPGPDDPRPASSRKLSVADPFSDDGSVGGGSFSSPTSATSSFCSMPMSLSPDVPVVCSSAHLRPSSPLGRVALSPSGGSFLKNRRLLGLRTRPTNPISASPRVAPHSPHCSWADEELAVPWRQREERLTKANSIMLRLGLHFDLGLCPTNKQPEPAPSLPIWAARHSPAHRNTEDPDWASNPHLQAALLHELQRQQELQVRIERREQRQEAARSQTEDLHRRGVLGLRAAMWRTVAALHTLDLPAFLVSRQRACRLAHRAVPVWRLFAFRARRRRVRERLLTLAAGRTPKLTPRELRAAGPLFREWPEPLLEAFIAEQQLAAFEEASYICHQGDPSDWLYVLSEGTVDVVLRRPDVPGKSRSKQSGLTVAQLCPGQYIGEYGVFTGEYRAATLYCAGPVVAWAASRPCLVRYLKALPTRVCRAITATFEATMAEIYRVRPAQLAQTPLFRGWDLPTLEQVVAQLEPVFFPEQTAILAAASPGTAVYVVAKGRCATTYAGRPVTVAAGGMLGVRACVFLEPNDAEVRATTTVQAWRLPRAALLDFMLRRPDRFLAAKARLNADAARALAKPSVEELLGSCALAKLPAAALQKLHACLQPLVIAARDPVVVEGGTVDRVLFVTAGQCSAGGAPLSGPGLCFGVEEVARGRAQWEGRVVAQERVEGWYISLQDLFMALESGWGKSRHPPLQYLMKSVATSLQRTPPPP